MRLDFKLVSQSKESGGSPTFIYKAIIEGLDGGQGKGYSKKESQQIAAKLTLEKLKREPQFIDCIFDAKANRTKMEEEPVEKVPDTEEKDDFIIVSQSFEDDGREDSVQAPSRREQAVAEETETDEDNEFDLSDISAKAMSREEIIAAAEAEAFGEAR